MSQLARPLLALPILAGRPPKSAAPAAHAGLQQELGRVFANREAGSALLDTGDVARLRVDGVQFEPGSQPQQIGKSMAQGIARESKR